jgi:uncharacterized membrane protein (UPF0127 family)
MHRFSLKPDHGMVFVFDRSELRAFWMKNTFIPLSIAFVAADGRIVNIDDMAPQDESTHWSSAPAMYAIEMRKGWFAERGFGPAIASQAFPRPHAEHHSPGTEACSPRCASRRYASMDRGTCLRCCSS